MVQFGALKSLTVWLQHVGRAGRSPTVQARAILLLKASALQAIQKKRTDNHLSSEDEQDGDGETRTYRKKLDLHLREFIETKRCRWDVADKLFNNLLCQGVYVHNDGHEGFSHLHH